jgi:hypothetical protein
MLDTTTIRNAFECLEYHIVTPLHLLDLSIVVFAALCFDRIVVQPMQGTIAEYFKQRSDIFSWMVYPDEFIPGTLWSLCVDSASDGRHTQGNGSDSHNTLEKAWGDFLGMNPGEFSLNLRAYDAHQDSPRYWSGELASHYSSELFQGNIRTPAQQAQRDEFLSIQTMRVLFNDKLSGFLELPYLTSSFRSCIHSQLIARKVETRLLLDKLLSAFGSPDQDAKKASPYVSEVSAPFLLGLILENMETPKDFWSELYKYRERFAPLRKDVLENRDKWEGSSANYLAKFQPILNKELDRLYRTGDDIIEAGISVGTKLATANATDFGLVGLGVKLLALLNPGEKLYKLTTKYFKPEVYLMFSLAHEAKQLRRVDERVFAIWGRRWTREELELLERLASSHPAEFLRLRYVG